MSERAKQIEQIARLAIIALLIIGSIVIILPFLSVILWAVVFTVTIWPLFIRVEKVLGGRTTLAAVVPALLLALIFFLPLVYLGSLAPRSIPDSLHQQISSNLLISLESRFLPIVFLRTASCFLRVGNENIGGHYGKDCKGNGKRDSRFKG